VKILLVNWQDPANPRAGGAEVHLRETFGRLQRRGHEVTWLVSGWRGAARRTVLDGMEVHRAGSRYTFGPASVIHYRRRLATRHADVVVEALNKVPLYSPKWGGPPVVLLVHHLFGTAAFREAPLPLAALTWLLERPLRRVYRHTPVQAISTSTAQDLIARGLPADAVTVIQPGIDRSFFNPSSSPSRAEVPTFLYLGRLQKYKRVDLIVSAFAEMRRYVPTARLVIAGTGDRLEPLRRLARSRGVAENVEFTGYVTEAEKRELFRRAWANVFVSPKEGWGITTFEAAACGTPTIASDSPGLREAVLHGRTGLLVPHGSLGALVDGMRRLAGDPALVERLGAAAEVLTREYTWERTARLTEEHLARVIAKRNAGASSVGQATEGRWRENH
jgi:glycosyltransferase involved in cell wall biosynthesis